MRLNLHLPQKDSASLTPKQFGGSWWSVAPVPGLCGGRVPAVPVPAGPATPNQQRDILKLNTGGRESHREQPHGHRHGVLGHPVCPRQEALETQSTESIPRHAKGAPHAPHEAPSTQRIKKHLSLAHFYMFCKNDRPGS